MVLKNIGTDMFTHKKLMLIIAKSDLESISKLKSELLLTLENEKCNIGCSLKEIILSSWILVNNSIEIVIEREQNTFMDSEVAKELRELSQFCNGFSFLYKPTETEVKGYINVKLSDFYNFQELHSSLKNITSISHSKYYNLDALIDDLCDFVTYSTEPMKIAFIGTNSSIVREYPMFEELLTKLVTYLTNYRMVTFKEFAV